MIDKVAENFKICDQIFENANLDYNDLKLIKFDESFFREHNHIRLINSFLFNFSKLQDKIGAKLFKNILYHLKEIDDEND